MLGSLGHKALKFKHERSQVASISYEAPCAPPSTTTIQKSSVTMAAPVRWFSDAFTSTLNRFCGFARLPTCVPHLLHGQFSTQGKRGMAHMYASTADVAEVRDIEFRYCLGDSVRSELRCELNQRTIVGGARHNRATAAEVTA